MYETIRSHLGLPENALLTLIEYIRTLLGLQGGLFL